MPITPNEALTRCIEHREIFHDEMLSLMRMLMRGEMSPSIASALLLGLRVKKETIGEIAAAAQVMRELLAAYRENEDLISIGAYRRGSDRNVDLAIDLQAEMQAYLRQRVDEPSSIERARDALLLLQRRVLARPQTAAPAAAGSGG